MLRFWSKSSSISGQQLDTFERYIVDLTPNTMVSFSPADVQVLNDSEQVPDSMLDALTVMALYSPEEIEEAMIAEGWSDETRSWLVASPVRGRVQQPAH